MGYAFAGLLSGLGQGIVKAGDTLEERRKQALEWAAKLQANRDDNETAARTAAMRENRADNRTAAEIDSREHVAAAEITSRAGMQGKQFAHEETMEEKRARHEEQLTRLRGDIESGQIRLRAATQAQVESGEVSGATYGPIDPKTGTGELILYTKGGKPVHTGERVMVPESRNNVERLPDAPDAAPRYGGISSNPFLQSKMPPGTVAAGDKTYTQADVIASARANGISTAEAERQIQQRGYTKAR